MYVTQARVLDGSDLNEAKMRVLKNINSWSPLEALEQLRAALPDISFALKEGVDPDVIRDLNTTIDKSRSGREIDLPEYAEMLTRAASLLPQAWEKHGEVSAELLAGIAATRMQLGKEMLDVALGELGITQDLRWIESSSLTGNNWEHSDIVIGDVSIRVGVSTGSVVQINGVPFTPAPVQALNVTPERIKTSILAVVPKLNQKAPYDKNDMSAAVAYTKVTKKLFMDGDIEGSFLHYMNDPNGGASASFHGTTKDQFVFDMQCFAGGPLATMQLTKYERQAWNEAGASHDEIESVARAGGFDKLRVSGVKLLEMQEILDHVMQNRIIGVRNKLRNLGWQECPNKSDLSKSVDGHQYRASLVCSHTGHGNNVVDFKFDVKDISSPEYKTLEIVDNKMNTSMKIMAAIVDGLVLGRDLPYSGRYIGEILSVDDAFAIQKTGRDETIKHSLAQLSASVQKGDLLDIQYMQGKGIVKDNGKTGQER